MRRWILLLPLCALAGCQTWTQAQIDLTTQARRGVALVAKSDASRDKALAELADSVANQPAVQRVPWYNQSHVMRIFRWVTSRPPRVQTLATVLAGQTRP